MNLISTERLQLWADRLGICLSWLCLIHCVMTPVVLLLLPGLSFIPAVGHSEDHEHFHEALLIVLPILALAAFVPGYRAHRNKKVFAWGIPGLILISLGVFVFHHGWETVVVTIPGSILLIRAHLLNRHLCSCCEHDHKATKLVAGPKVTPLRKISPEDLKMGNQL